MRAFAHPVWLVGFRPFFALAMLAGAVLPWLWVALYTGAASPLSAAPHPAPVWHAHEMLYGFGWATLGGFLLTASKNWVGIRGWHGGVLTGLVLLWLLDRWAMAGGAGWPQAALWMASLAYQVAVSGLLLHTLIRHRASDSYRADNLYFIAALLLFPLAKALLLSPGAFAAGVDMSLALFRLAFLLMLERTLTQFMKNALKTELPRHAGLDHAIKGLALLLAVSPWLPPAAAAGLEAVLAVLIALRTALWSPRRGCSRLEIGVMYFGMLAIAAHLALRALAVLAGAGWAQGVATHVFTLGTIGCIVPAMFVRIANGHTGRKVVFTAPDRRVLWLMIGGLAARVLPALLKPDWTIAGYWLAATCWGVGFLLLAWRFIPFLIAARVDGREH